MREAETWAEEYAVRAYEVDVGGRASVPTLCNWLQETAGIHAAHLGWSIHRLGEEGLTWVLQRLRLRLDGAAVWGERVRVETWPAGTQRLFALRDFRFTLSSGEPIGVATSSWMLINVASRRPVRPPLALEELAVPSAGRALVDDFTRTPDLGGVSHERALEVRFGDLDVNGHANNVAVISWLLEALPGDDLAGRLAELDVEFRAEAVRGDLLACQAERLGTSPPAFIHRVVRRSDGREIARGRTAWLAPVGR
jgi:medium-chain acyl-[acyl-carrier-protein] hydrolase